MNGYVIDVDAGWVSKIADHDKQLAAEILRVARFKAKEKVITIDELEDSIVEVLEEN